MKLGKYEIQIDQILDLKIRENFKNMTAFLNENPFLKSDFRFFKYKANASGAYTVPHSLSFTPLDVMMLSSRGSDTTQVTWQYDKFNDETVSFLTNGPVTIRALIGRHKD